MLASHYEASMSQCDSFGDRFIKEPGTVLSVEIISEEWFSRVMRFLA